ncbi:MAG: class I SAM-dependent methyltransferase [bacterium]|nr:class I SAM-dependent methyltransferase [bacterium]
MSENYDDAYRQADWFGPEPSELLRDHADLLPPGARILDLGVGQGRNALPLARRGCVVAGIDTSAVSVETVMAIAAGEDLPLAAELTDFRTYCPDTPFDAVLCFGLLQMLPPPDAARLTEKLRDWVRPGGHLFLTAWHTGDPRCEDPAVGWEATGPRSFRDPSGDRHRFYLHPDEILDFFPGWQVVHHWEGFGPEHRHGDGQPERHGAVDVVLTRPAKPSVEIWTHL